MWALALELTWRCTLFSLSFNSGIIPFLQVFWTGNKGWGIRCLEDLPANTFLCQYAGEVRHDDSSITDEPYVSDLSDKMRRDEEVLVIDAKWCILLSKHTSIISLAGVGVEVGSLIINATDQMREEGESS